MAIPDIRPPGLRRPEHGPFNIAMLAPPWIPIPPPGYGGIELVVGALCEGLVRLGHNVTLYAAPGSRSSATVREVLPRCHPYEIGHSLYEIDHVARVLADIDDMADQGNPFDILHDHCGFTAVALADRIRVPVVHTMHGPFTVDTSAFYRQYADQAWLVAISEAQRATAPPGLRLAGVVPNPIEVPEWPFRPTKEDYVLWVGRFEHFKGPHRAIAAAREANVRLILAGPIQRGQEAYFQREIAPHLDGNQVRYLGEVGGGRKQQLFANARALLMPISWIEPFGMVMVEAMACGTPVIAFPQGAATEIVQPGLNGFLVDDEETMAAAIANVGQIDPAACRESVDVRFNPEVVAAGYEAIYRRVTTPRLATGVAG
jgi:glycosyltransferase involved in cell wall biosynthesis